jgi:hypothetical protein
MRTLLARVVAASCLIIAGAATAKAPDFAETTRVEGKAPASFGGAWFLYAQAQFPGDKTRALPPQLFTVSPGRDGNLTLHVLDVQMPKAIDAPYKAGSRQPKAWEPSPADIALLRKEWSKLPPATNKDWRASEVVYDRVEFTVASPEKYAEVFTKGDPGIDEALAGSVFALQVVEKYRPQQTPAEERVAQAMQRTSIYVVRSATDSVLEGKQFTGYVAAGPGMALPLNVYGPFKLYRLAKGTAAPSPAPPAPGRRRPARR